MQSATYSLLGNSNLGEQADKVEIEYFELPSHSLFEKRRLLVKVYKNRYYCPIGGLAKNKGEEDYTALKMTEAFGMRMIQLRYQLFAIQPQPKKDPHLYWVRIE